MSVAAAKKNLILIGRKIKRRLLPVVLICCGLRVRSFEFEDGVHPRRTEAKTTP